MAGIVWNAMGLFDIFGGGDADEREEMRENIEQIRDKVQSQQGSGQPAAGQQPQPRQEQGGPQPSKPSSDQGSRRPQPQQGGRPKPPERQSPTPRGGADLPRGESFDQPAGRKQPRQPPAEQPDRGPAPAAGQTEDPARERQRPAPAAAEEEEFEWTGLDEPETATQQEEQERAAEPVEAARERLAEAKQREDLSVPEAPEVRELDIPNIEKGPLFITVSKFRGALQTVSRLETISHDLETFAEAMEDTLHEDREMNELMSDRMEAANENIEYIKQLVSPK